MGEFDSAEKGVQYEAQIKNGTHSQIPVLKRDSVVFEDLILRHRLPIALTI